MPYFIIVSLLRNKKMLLSSIKFYSNSLNLLWEIRAFRIIPSISVKTFWRWLLLSKFDQNLWSQFVAYSYCRYSQILRESISKTKFCENVCTSLGCKALLATTDDINKINFSICWHIISFYFVIRCLKNNYIEVP